MRVSALGGAVSDVSRALAFQAGWIARFVKDAPEFFENERTLAGLSTQFCGPTDHDHSFTAAVR